MLILSERVEDGKQAMAEMKEETTEIASLATLADKLNAIANDSTFEMPSTERLPDNNHYIDGIGFDGKRYFVETDGNIGTEHIGTEWLEFKQHANRVYRERHCNTEKVQGTLDMLNDSIEQKNVEFTKNTIRVLKTGQLSVNIKAKVDNARCPQVMLHAEILATMRAKIADARAKAQSNTDES